MKSLENLTIHDYFAIVRRRMWYLIVTTVLVSLGTVVYVRRLPSTYKSETTIVVSNRVVPEDYIGSMVRESSNERIEFVRQQLQSRTFLERIVQEFQLADVESNMEGVVNGVRNRIEITVLSASALKLGFIATDPSVAQAVTRRLSEGVIQLNNSFRKEKVYVADQFLDEQLRQAANELSQMEDKRRQFNSRYFGGVPIEGNSLNTLRESETALAKLNANLETAVNNRKSLERRLTENAQLKTVLKAAPAPPRASTAAEVNVAGTARTPNEDLLAAKRSELAVASRRYTSRHPEVVRLSQEVRELESIVNRERAIQTAAVPAPKVDDEAPTESAAMPEIEAADFVQAEFQLELERVNEDILKLEQDKKELQIKISTYQARLNPAPEIAQELAAIERDYETAKQRYTYLSGKTLNSDLAAQADTSDDNEMFRVIDEANLPQQPIGPNRRLLALAGGLAGMLLGFGIAFVRDFLDSSLHDEKDAAELKLTVLASIPEVTGQHEKQPHGQTLTVVRTQIEDPRKFHFQGVESKIKSVVLNPTTVGGEHYRLVRAKLSSMKKERGLKSLMVTSAVPNEGKTFTACCLAGILAQERGKRVLLIDADLRTSNATKVLGLGDRAASGSLDELLRVEGDLQDHVLQCADFNLYFLPSSAKAVRASQDLSSPELERVMHEATQFFDWVIVDAPPILAVADAHLIAPLCDSTLLVVHSGKTPAKLINESLDRIGRQRLCGLLMNRVKTIESSYYHGQYYKSTAIANSTEPARKSSKVVETQSAQTAGTGHPNGPTLSRFFSSKHTYERSAPTSIAVTGPVLPTDDTENSETHAMQLSFESTFGQHMEHVVVPAQDLTQKENSQTDEHAVETLVLKPLNVEVVELEETLTEDGPITSATVAPLAVTGAIELSTEKPQTIEVEEEAAPAEDDLIMPAPAAPVAVSVVIEPSETLQTVEVEEEVAPTEDGPITPAPVAAIAVSVVIEPSPTLAVPMTAVSTANSTVKVRSERHNPAAIKNPELLYLRTSTDKRSSYRHIVLIGSAVMAVFAGVWVLTTAVPLSVKDPVRPTIQNVNENKPAQDIPAAVAPETGRTLPTVQTTTPKAPVPQTPAPRPANANPGIASPPSAPSVNPVAVSGTPGTLALSSPVLTEIYKGGELIASTPTTLELPPGSHTLEYRYRDQRKTVTHVVRSNETTTAMVTFDITVQINARPWAQVFLDGVARNPLGQTPLSDVQVPIGSVLVFENPDFPGKKYRVTERDTAIQMIFP